jgi:hypothetical protein
MAPPWQPAGPSLEWRVRIGCPHVHPIMVGGKLYVVGGSSEPLVAPKYVFPSRLVTTLRTGDDRVVVVVLRN